MKEELWEAQGEATAEGKSSKPVLVRQSSWSKYELMLSAIGKLSGWLRRKDFELTCEGAVYEGADVKVVVMETGSVAIPVEGGLARTGITMKRY